MNLFKLPKQIKQQILDLTESERSHIPERKLRNILKKFFTIDQIEMFESILTILCLNRTCDFRNVKRISMA